MSISDKIEGQKAELIDKYITAYKSTGKGISKALKLMQLDIEKMRNDKLSLAEQIVILNSIFNITIKYDTYKKWSKRHFEKEAKSIKKSSLKKTSISLDEIKQKKEVKRVAPIEPKKSKIINHNPIADPDELW